MTTRTPSSPERARPRRRRPIADPKRFAPLAITALLALIAGIVVGARHEPSEKRSVTAFALAWQRGDYGAMYSLLSDDARARTSQARLERTYKNAAAVLTLLKIRTGKVSGGGETMTIPVVFQTRVFGTLRGELIVGLGERKGEAKGVDWNSTLVYPGLRRGEKLRAVTTMPPRATIQARDGTAIAKGPQRTSDLGPEAADIAGTIGPAPADRVAALKTLGVPASASVGLTGLEREFDDRLLGRPGGTLYAGQRVLARTRPVAAGPVRTTIDPAVQRAAVAALAGRYGGIAVVSPDDGEVLALAGIAQSAPQPPGSTFKIVTLAGILDHHVAKKGSTYPYQNAATIEGVEVDNANGESCGGSLRSSFANSCNSVFAPLGAKLGAKDLVATAEKFGFNADPAFAGEAPSTIPAAGEIGDDLAVGSSAIGQGKVLATPLEMALIAATIADEGVRHQPTLLKGSTSPGTRATSASTAHWIASAMRTVVTSGTGAAASLPGVKVAGKTGTAELRTTVRPSPSATPDPSATPQPDDPSDTDAWFAAFAPMSKPRVAVAVLLVGQGAGGATAAPAARVVLQAALK